MSQPQVKVLTASRRRIEELQQEIRALAENIYIETTQTQLSSVRNSQIQSQYASQVQSQPINKSLLTSQLEEQTQRLISPKQGNSISNQKISNSMIAHAEKATKTPEKIDYSSKPTRPDEHRYLSKSTFTPEVTRYPATSINGNVSPILGNLSKLHARVDNIIQKSPVQLGNSGRKDSASKETYKFLAGHSSGTKPETYNSYQPITQPNYNIEGVNSVLNGQSKPEYLGEAQKSNHTPIKNEETLKKSPISYRNENLQTEKSIHHWDHNIAPTNRSILSINSTSAYQSTSSPKKNVYDKNKLDRILQSINNRGPNNSIDTRPSERASTLY